MKKTRIIYWITTILFLGMMLFSAVSSLMMPDKSEALFKTLNLPSYLISFLSIAKILGVIAILIPGFPRLKEWAYAGLFFDITGAVYSMICAHGFDPMMLTLLVPVGMGILSYIYHHKLLRGE